MKLNRSEIRKLIFEVLNEENNVALMRSQNRELENAMYEYIKKFALAPEDKELLNSPHFGHRNNSETVTDRAAMSILDSTGIDLGLQLQGDDRPVKYVFCFFHFKFLDKIFGSTENGMNKLQRMIDFAKNKTGNSEVEIKIGRTGNSRKYDSILNDHSVYTINRMS